MGERRALAKLSTIIDNTSHPLHQTVGALSSSFSNRLRHPRCRKECFHRRAQQSTAARYCCKNQVCSQKNKDRYVAAGLALPGPHTWSQAWGWGSGLSRRAPGGRVFARDGTRAQAQPEMATWVGPPSSRLTTTTRRKVHEGPVQCGLGSSRGRGPRRPNPRTKTLAIGTWNVTSLGGKEPELSVREVERYRLEIVGLTSTHSLGSGTQLLERGWTLHYSGVAQGERRRAGVGLLIAPQLSRHVLEFTPVKQRGSLPCAFGLGIGLLLLFVHTGPNSSTEYPWPSWSPWEGYLIVLRLGTPLFYWGTSTLTW
ncbi:hypothetical protein L3Q82_005849 [Scortum barcoo]|uniref:Uncharacterized protein n=1 Tax=Scortum barcoo TaxID=214431 RepID=A0ACB8V6V9_9TELE|nr:hypothetical protein L3Q82_005849 [Scortum barcoo]